MKSSKIIFVSYSLILLFYLFINPNIYSISEYFGVGPIMFNNLLHAFIITSGWGVREFWLWRKTNAPTPFSNVTKVGMFTMIAYFANIVLQEYLNFDRCDGEEVCRLLKRSEYPSMWYYSSIISVLLLSSIFYLIKKIITLNKLKGHGS